jgi:hypothetical protein
MFTRSFFGARAARRRLYSPRSPQKSPPLVLERLEDRCLMSADPVLEWNAIALDALKNDSYLGANAKQAGPDRASRALAIVQAAVFDAVNSIDRSYDPYLIQVNAPRDASIGAATAQAAHDTLANLFPDYKPVLDGRLAADLAADLSGASSIVSEVEGVVVGHVVAAAILAARSNDGADVPMNYTFGSGPGAWQPDPLHPNQTPVGSLWGNVTPFALTSAEQFEAPPLPALTSQEYTDAFNEVNDYGGDGVTTPTLRTPEETQIGIFWGYDGSPGVGTPPRHYNQIAETIAVQEGNTVVQNARFFALINLSMADAAISCWDNKYDYNFWRPVTGIRDAAIDGNPLTTADPNWTPLGAPADNGSGTNFTPPFPSYGSGHAAFGGALFGLMADFYGRDDVHFTIGSDEFNGVTKDQNGVVRPVVFRSFDSFSQAAEENGQSRIYLGIHWSFDKVQGILQGNDIADYVFQHLLRPAHDRGRGQAFDAGLEQVYEQSAAPAGPVLAPVHFGGREEWAGNRAFRLNQDLKPVNIVVEVEASRLQETAGKDPMSDLNAVFESPDLFQTL